MLSIIGDKLLYSSTTPSNLSIEAMLIAYELQHARYCLDRAISNHESDYASEYRDETHQLMAEYHTHVQIAYSLEEQFSAGVNVYNIVTSW